MSLNVELLRSSFKAVSHKADRLVEKFYELLFDRYPSVRPLFENARMEEQRKMLLRSIALIVRKVDDTNYIVPYLQGLGKTHVAYGTKPEHYDAVGECLIVALADTAGSLWTKEMEETWLAAYGVIKENMLKGANS